MTRGRPPPTRSPPPLHPPRGRVGAEAAEGGKPPPVAAFCHRGCYTCWGARQGLGELEETLASRLASAPEGSYTKRLFNDVSLFM